MNKRWYILLVLLLLLPALACGGDDPTPIVIVVTSPPGQSESPTEAAPPPAQTGAIEILEANFAHGLSDEMQAIDPGSEFQPDETIYLSLTIKGRPKEGAVTARFYWDEVYIAEASIDLADVNSGLLFSIGENTYAGYTLTHEQPFPIGDGYRADLFYNDQALGSYPFRVVPPADAIATVINSVTLARGADENYNPIEPTTQFSAADTVYLVGNGNLGLETWLQADWFVSGQLDEAGTRSLTLEENIENAGFAFSFVPEGGWPAGEHWVILAVNNEEIGRYSFTTQ
jgi:hypothetical protein